jgi:hypothetical protein
MSILSFLRHPAKQQTGIYKIVNRRNGFIYIGATTQPMVIRWDQHRRRLLNDTHHNSRLQADWNLYGARAFRFAAVEVVSTDRVFDRERDWQRIYYATGRCYNPDPDAPPPWMRPSTSPRETLLLMFKEMRANGMSREQARQVLKAEGIPLDNNLWAKAGMNRDDARALLKPWGIPLDNNVWAEVGAVLEKEAAPYVTPYVGRPTSARFETDQDFPYQAPA